MRMFNADGSESEMCGNGIRCVGKYVYDNGLTRKESVRIETLAGIRLLRLHPEGGKVKTVTVDMGEPRLAPRDIPVSGEGETFVSRPLKVGGRVWQVTAVSMGNPHAIVFTEGIDRLDLPQLGPLFEHHPLFPRRTNTEFVEIVDRGHVKMRVWERGAGETLACGTGASAVAVAGVLTGHTDRKVHVELLGGELDIEWDETSNHVFMTGGAVVVFTGDYPGEALSEAAAGETANGTDE
ncbi:MAG: diaminopimelate epimerase [Bilophila sp.]